MLLQDCTRPGVPLVGLHGEEGPVFWPLSEVALLREEWDGRLEATHSGGPVAHRPGPLDPFRRPPLHPAGPGALVNPSWARLAGAELHLPGGWRIPAVDLPPPAAVPEPDPDAVLAALQSGRRWAWITTSGERPGPSSRPESRRQVPDLVPAGRGLLVRPGAVRALVRRGDSGSIVLEGGREVEARWASLAGLARALGLAFPDPLAGLPQPHREVYRRGLRDWPEELLRQEAGHLRSRYGRDASRLMDDVIWETFRLRSRGRGQGHGRNPRGLFYNPFKAVAERAGLLGPAPLTSRRRALLRLLAASLPRALTGGRERLWKAFEARLDDFVGELRILTYLDLGFVDRPANRRLGTARPEIVLLVEKSSLEVDALVLAELFGVSVLVLGGFPNWIATEFFARHLRTVHAGPVRIVAFCDYDPYGWMFPLVFSRQLERYGVATEGLSRLVTPEAFTPEELDLLSLELPVNEYNRKLVEDWVRETGGVRGLARGLYADFLRPVERLIEAFRRATGLEPVR